MCVVAGIALFRYDLCRIITIILPRTGGIRGPQSHARIVRSAADSDLVWLHVHSTNGKDDLGQAVLDVFRVKNGKIVEPWDVTQDVPAKSANLNTMF